MPNLPTLRSLFVSGQTAEALKQLSSWAETQSPAWRQAGLLLQAGWSQNEQEAAAGTISYDDATRVRNRITQGAIGMLDQIESGAQSPQAVLEELKKEFLNERVAQALEHNETNITGSHINVQGSKVVVVGSGNTVSKKVFTALGRRQFWGILALLAVLLVGGYYGVSLLSGQQSEAFISLKDIQKELGVLADLNAGVRAKLENNQAEIEGWLAKGMDAFKSGDYPTAVQYLEQVAAEVPLATVHQNLASAYEQMGNADKVRENLNAAQKINPNLDLSKSYAQLKGKRIDLLAQENGGKILVSAGEQMLGLVDGKTAVNIITNKDFAVFSFKDKKTATFSQFKYYVPDNSPYNFIDFELFYGNDTPTGEFKSIGTFKAVNALLSETPFQEFNFAPVTAKYFKVQLLERSPNGYSYEMQLMGELK